MSPVAWIEQDPAQPIDLDEVSRRASEVNLGPWVPGVGIVHCIPALVAELRDVRAKLAALVAGGLCRTCLGQRYITDDRGVEHRCPTCEGSGRSE